MERSRIKESPGQIPRSGCDLQLGFAAAANLGIEFSKVPIPTVAHFLRDRNATPFGVAIPYTCKSQGSHQAATLGSVP